MGRNITKQEVGREIDRMGCCKAGMTVGGWMRGNEMGLEGYDTVRDGIELNETRLCETGRDEPEQV